MALFETLRFRFAPYPNCRRNRIEKKQRRYTEKLSSDAPRQLVYAPDVNIEKLPSQNIRMVAIDMGWPFDLQVFQLPASAGFFIYTGPSMSKITPHEAGSYAGAVVSIGSSLTLTDFGIIVGIVTALLTFGLNAYYMRRRDLREQEESEARLAELRGHHE